MGDDGKKFIPSGVMLRCSMGTAPTPLTVLPKTANLYDESYATEFDAAPGVNIVPFGTCNAKPVPCPCVPATAVWMNPMMTGLMVNGQRPIKEDSKCLCGQGGMIEIIFLKPAGGGASSQTENQQKAKEDEEAAKKAKETSSTLFWCGIAAAAVIGVVAIVATGGAAAPLVAAAAEVALEGAVVGAGIGATVGGVAGGIEGAAHGGVKGALKGAVSGIGQGALMGAAGGAVCALGGAPLLMPSLGAFGVGVAFDGKAMYDDPSKEHGLVLLSDAVILLGAKALEGGEEDPLNNETKGSSSQAKDAAYQLAKELLESRSKRQMPRAVSAVYDRVTGKTYTGESSNVDLEDLDPSVRDALPKESLEPWKNPENCAEVDAYNKAIKDGANPEDLDMHTVKIDKKTGEITDFERCNNCKETTKDVGNVTSDPD